MSVAEYDLQVLANMQDQELHTRIKAQHPLWSDEVVEEQVKDMRSTDFAEWYAELLK